MPYHQIKIKVPVHSSQIVLSLSLSNIKRWYILYFFIPGGYLHVKTDKTYKEGNTKKKPHEWGHRKTTVVNQPRRGGGENLIKGGREMRNWEIERSKAWQSFKTISFNETERERERDVQRVKQKKRERRGSKRKVTCITFCLDLGPHKIRSGAEPGINSASLNFNLPLSLSPLFLCSDPLQ